jgi:hypothetical protein
VLARLNQHHLWSLLDRLHHVSGLLGIGSLHGCELTCFRIATNFERTFSHFHLLCLAFREEMGGSHRPPAS